MELNIICFLLFWYILTKLYLTSMPKDFWEIPPNQNLLRNKWFSFDLWFFHEWLKVNSQEDREERRWLKQAGWLVLKLRSFPGFAWLFLSHIISLERIMGNDIKVTTPWEQVCPLLRAHGHHWGLCCGSLLSPGLSLSPESSPFSPTSKISLWAGKAFLKLSVLAATRLSVGT